MMISFAVLLLLSGLVVYAATTLFTQSFPAQTFNTASLTSGCGTLVFDTYVTYAPSAPFIGGQPAQIVFDCGNSGVPLPYGTPVAAFSTTGTTSTTVTVTPTFTVPTGWTLGIETTPPGGSGTCSGTTTLTTTSSVTLTGGTGYFYCLTTSSASPTLDHSQ